MKCPFCDNEAIVVYENKNMPFGVNLKDKTIDLEISYCRLCTFVFQSSSYTLNYDTTVNELYKSYKISNVYNFPNRNFNNLKALSFVKEFINNSIEYNVLEIGSNRGDFLFLLKEEFPTINILGCEPTSFKELKVPTINAFFNEDLFNTKFDLIIIRHTLEHIKDTKLFLSQLSSISKEDTKIFIEVPNIIYSLNNYIEDFTPDHVNYFSINTLVQLFSNMNLCKYDDSEYLYAIFDNSRIIPKINKKFNIEDLFSQYNVKMEEVKRIILKYDRIIFYGVGNFYLWTYTKLKDIVKDKEIYFADDNINKDDLFNLKKLNDFQEGDLVILCSSNQNIQNKMKKRIPNNCVILSPWKGINNV